MGYYVKPIVCDYGVYSDYNNELCLVCNRKANAELIVKILQVDNGDDAEHHHDKVCRDYKPNCTRKPLERIVERLDKKVKFVDTKIEQKIRWGHQTESDQQFMNGIMYAIEIIKEEE